MNSVSLRITAALVLALGVSGMMVRSADSSSSSSIDQLWFWPPAPEKPRVQHIKTFITPQDLDIKKGFFGRVWEFIAGKDTADRIVSPHGIVANGEGKVYVADWGGSRIHFFDFSRKKYDTFSKTREGGLVSPIGVALDGDGLLYVSDSVKRKVYVFDGDRNKRVIGDEKLLRPTGIAINKKEKILYVVDTIAHRVDMFDLFGRAVHSFGGPGSQDGEFNYPTHIALDAAGDVYVMDALNFRVQIFDKRGTFITKFGSTGTSISDFIKPKGIAVDSDGHIWVSDSFRSSIQVFNRQGQLLLIFGRMGIGRGEFNIPSGMYIDVNDRLFVADSYNYRVQTFQYLAQEK
jgi:sugar lactone lactonase YvrE